ncbi:MAG TPA: AraC family transcriptional regulator [Epulopiscium sp.]|nr:AraC family transcriptional regulator [Candidatus Epulonipiscium sp.]
MPTLNSLYQLLYKSCNFHISRYYCQNFTTFQMDLHSHPAFEIMYVAKGICDISYHSHNKTSHTQLKAGEFVFIDCHVPHMLQVNNSSPCRILNLEIELINPPTGTPGVTELLNTSADFIEFLKHKKPVIIIQDIAYKDSLQDIMFHIHSYVENQPNSLLLDLELLKLLALLSLKHIHYSDHIIGLHYIKKAKEYIDKHFDSEIYIDDISHHVGISSAYLQRLFSSQLHTSISDYMIKKRIHKSILLLQHTNAPIIDIALDTGFNSRQHFSYTFKKLMNISPQQFRKVKETYEIPFTVKHF